MPRKQKKQSKFGAYVIMGMMVFLMVGSMLGVMLYAPQSFGDLIYGDMTFTIEDGMYVTEVDGRSLRFNNPPNALVAVNVSAEAMNAARAAPYMIVTFDPELSEESLLYIDFARFELASALGNLGGGVTRPSPAYAFPVITCANATPQTPVVVLSPGSPGIRNEGSCITISGNQTTLLLAKDAFIFNYYGLGGV